MTWANGHRTIRDLTPLNEATSKAYAACEMTGGHVPSGDTVDRIFPGTVRVLPVCANCGVPYGGPKPPNWASGAPRGPKMPE